MVALVQHGTRNVPVAIHRTFLRPDASGKADVEPAKMALGPIRGGAVRLAKVIDEMMIGEGVEDCLTCMAATGIPAWATLGTAGLVALDLPEHIRTVIVLADNDRPGIAAAHEAAWRWSGEGRTVRIALPPTGKDFNAALLAERAP